MIRKRCGFLRRNSKYRDIPLEAAEEVSTVREAGTAVAAEDGENPLLRNRAPLFRRGFQKAPWNPQFQQNEYSAEAGKYCCIV
jgi:hypothetical protein